MAYYDNAPSHKPQGKKSFGREKWVEEGSEYRGARHGGRPSGKRDDNRAYGEKKSFGDRKPYGEKKSFGDRKPYGEKKSFGDRKPYGEKKSYDDRKPYERRDRYDRRPEMTDERPAPSYRDSEYRPVAVAPVMAQPVAEEAVQENLLAGRNPIREALKAGRDIEKLLVQKGELTGSAREIVQMAKEAHIPVQEVEHQRLNELAKNHQGMVAFASAYQYSTVEAMLAEAEEKGEEPFLILLDGITDPHNLGAIIRSAECVGAHGVIVPERRAVGLTPAAVKASAGAIEHIKVARVVNMTRVIEMLKARNIWTYALTMDGTDYEKVNFKGGVALVVGSEGEGISHLVLENCDQKVSLPMAGLRVERVEPLFLPRYGGRGDVPRAVQPPGMKPLLIVDGYNVIGAWSEAEKKGWSLDESRDRLMRQLEDYAGFSGEEILLVFDGYQSERTTTTEEKHGDLTLIFTRHGETADSYIERAAAQTPRYRELRVATSDGLEQSQVLSSGAIRMTSRELLRELREMRKSGMSAHQNQPNMNRNTIFSRMPEDIRARLEKLRRGE